MALIHEELYQKKDLGRINLAEYIRELADNLCASYAVKPEQITLSMELEDVEISIDTAIPCGLILNELISNSLKHAFPGDRQGKIGVALSTVDGEKYLLTVNDNGVGLPEGLDYRKSRSMGMQLVVVLAQQLGSELFHDSSDGASFSLTFSEYTEASPGVF